MTENPAAYPVRVDAAPEPEASRGLWLVKWLLLVPHYVVLAFLWLAFVVVGLIAFFAILFTGRYPRPLFDFNVGVLRWTWRVQYYGYAALGTDRYPPFTLAEVPDYPAHLDVPYPERLSRGLVLVKWWLLALPHYLVLAVFVGGGIWLGTAPGDGGRADDGWAYGGLVALLVLVAAVVLLFTGRYPRPLYDFVMGMDRWALRVAAYVSLMTDAYPPFRLDMGGPDPGSVPAGPSAPAPVPGDAAQPVPSRPGSSWTAGRVVSVVIGSVLLFTATGLIGGGGTLLWADTAQREDGFVWTEEEQLTSDGFAVTSGELILETTGAEWVFDDLLGEARLEVTADDPRQEVFVGIAPAAAVDDYLAGVRHTRVDEFGRTWWSGPATTDVPGRAPAAPPADLDFWTASASGTGTQVVDWQPADGRWIAVVMRSDAGAGLAVEGRAGAELPALTGIAVGLLAAGGVLLVAGALLIGLAVHGAHRTPPSGPIPPSAGPRVPVGTGSRA